MKKRELADLFSDDVQIRELDGGQLEEVWAGIVNCGCVNTQDCEVGQGTNCGNIEVCLVATAPAET